MIDDPEFIGKKNRKSRRHKKLVKTTYQKITGKVFTESFGPQERMSQYFCAKRTKFSDWAERMNWS